MRAAFLLGRVSCCVPPLDLVLLGGRVCLFLRAVRLKCLCFIVVLVWCYVPVVCSVGRYVMRSEKNRVVSYRRWLRASLAASCFGRLRLGECY